MTTDLDLTATSSARQLLLTASFWRDHGRLLALLLGGAVGLIWLLPFVLHSSPAASDSAAQRAAIERLNWVFALVQLGVLCFAAYAASQAAAQLAINRAWARLADEKAQQQLDLMRSGQGAPLGLNQVTSLLPTPLTTVPPAVFRLAVRVVEEARGRRIDSLNNLLEPYQQETCDDLAALERGQRTSLRLGILGTFVGLLLGLQSIPNLLEGAGQALGSSAEQRFTGLAFHLLSSLELAFGTSVMGLCAALWIAGLATVCRDRQQAYLRELDTAALQLVSLAGEAENPDSLLTGLDQASKAMNEVGHRVYDHARKVERSLENVGSQVEGQTETIREGMEKLVTVRTQFDGFLKEVSASQDGFLRELRSVYDVVSLKRLFDKLEGSLEASADGISRRLAAVQEQATTIATHSAKIDTTLGDIESKVARAAGESRGVLERLQPGLAKLEQSMEPLSRLGSFALESGFFRWLFFASLLGLVAGAAITPKSSLGPLAGALLLSGTAMVYRWSRSA